MVFEHLRAGTGDWLIVADHASNQIPPDLMQLGLPPDALGEHIAFDIGTADLARALSTARETEAVISTVSRLVIDKNRRTDQDGLIPEQSDGRNIPGNYGLDEAGKKERIDRFYRPYHAHIAKQVATRPRPRLLSLHSFTPVMNASQRPWDCGLLYNRDDRLAQTAIAFFKAQGLCVGDNEPYPGSIYNATMDQHAEAHGHPYLMLEVRNDHLRTLDQIALWTQRIMALLDEIDAALNS